MGPRPPIHSNADPKEVAARWARQGSPIGKGGFGTVWRVVWESGSGPKEAALKLVDVPALCAGANSAQIKQDIQRELDLAARLSQIQGITSMLEAFVEPSGATPHPACIRSKFLLDARALHPALHPCSAQASAQASAQTLLCTRSAPPYTPLAAGVVHLVMEICSGPTLQWVLDKRGALSEVETQAIMRQLLEAVAHLHASWLKSSHTLWLARRLWPLQHTPVGTRSQHAARA